MLITSAICFRLCSFDCWQLCTKTSERICMKFSGKVDNGPVSKWLHFGGDLVHRLDTGIVSGFVTIGRYGKWLTDINVLFILIRQMAALVRHALADICTVPVLLVHFCIIVTWRFWVRWPLGALAFTVFLANVNSRSLLANVNLRSRSLYAIACPSVCLSVCLSVCRL